MIAWLAIILLLVIGLGLIIAEIIFIPGVTVVGLLGLGFVISGIVISFLSFGSSTGLIILAITLFLGTVIIVMSLKSGVWNKFSLKSSIDSKFNDGLTKELHSGQTGITVSALRPMGKAEFGNKVYEVTTLGLYLKQGEKIEILKINENKIIVGPINS